ncbi:ABC-F family ATP-binding cassette domain-containing protein [Armatimonas sp.]|uniref:ABC-F family ATP-binding cassette domain-containing protein n=1 Tax=Armatimonas sp. TaxID=1872638 RepID=UPI00286D5A6F|nr:ABC-F family ATP-binding cassette domain-containing protein [Armatimonas sp.]
MATLLSAQGIEARSGGRTLFTGLTFGIEDTERLGLIGPNGAGKSTMLKALAGMGDLSGGTVSMRRGLQVGYVAQDEAFEGDQTVEQALFSALDGTTLDETEKVMHVEISLAQCDFPDRNQKAAQLSGGWKKRLAIAQQLLKEPDVLFLDEPTNHLDLQGVEWLEEILENPPFAFVVITHDRYFLENTTTKLMDLNSAYAEGYLSVKGGYSEYLEAKAAYLLAQGRKQDSLESTAKVELAWLRRGARARSTKAKGRIEDVGEVFAELDSVKRRNAEKLAMESGFSASGRQTKELLVAKNLSKTLGGRELFSGLDLTLTPGLKLGLVGLNGSGKTTLLRLLLGTLEADTGTVKRADGLRTVFFSQNRDNLDFNVTLRNALAPASDTISYRNSTIHVTGWAKKFGFREDQLGSKVGSLSGGEQARLAIAKLMLQPADLLVLDEPTNDLDLASLGSLEEGMESFPGALVLVSHDRFILDKVCNQVLVLGEGEPTFYADFTQWAEHRRNRTAPTAAPKAPKAATPAVPIAPLRPLSTAERRELSKIEETIHTAEEKVSEIEARMAAPEIATNAAELQRLWAKELPTAKAAVERLYARWEELESRK